jgi:hypothetical protein
METIVFLSAIRNNENLAGFVGKQEIKQPQLKASLLLICCLGNQVFVEGENILAKQES